MPSSLSSIAKSFPYPLVDYTAPLVKPGPLIAAGWETALKDHPDKQYRAVILDIIKFGAKIGYTGPKQRILSENLPTANDAPGLIAKDLQTQIEHGRVTQVDYGNLPEFLISSPLGLVPKATKGKWRRIHHLSHPRGKSVNCHILEDYGALEYTSVDEAIAAVLIVGQGARLVKRDLADAFRHIPVAEADWWLLFFMWEDKYFFERFLPFGLRTSPYLFDLFAKGLNWMLINAEWRTLHYLDDFFTVLESDLLADAYEKHFATLCTALGLKVNEEKNVRGTLVEFLGIEIDSLAMEARLPESKLQRARTWVKQTLQNKQISRDELRSLLGFLSFAAKVVVPGRTFLRRLFNALSKYQKVYHLSADMRADLAWWDKFLPQWNGIKMLQRIETRRRIDLWTDASGLFGMGGYYLNENELVPPTAQAFSIRLHTRLRNKHITVKEMMAVLHALQLWAHEFEGARLIIHGDNTGVVNGLQNLSIRGPALSPLREIAMILALRQITIESLWLSSEENLLADILSRGQWAKLADEYKHLQEIIPNAPR